MNGKDREERDGREGMKGEKRGKVGRVRPCCYIRCQGILEA